MGLFAEDATLHGGPRFEKPFEGRRALREMFELYFSGFGEMLFTPSEVFLNENEAITFMTLSATVPVSTSGSRTHPPDPVRRRVSWRGAYRFVLDSEGRISYLAIYGDESSSRWISPTDAGTRLPDRSLDSPASPSVKPS